jgi:hypothetical protein
MNCSIYKYDIDACLWKTKSYSRLCTLKMNTAPSVHGGGEEKICGECHQNVYRNFNIKEIKAITESL